MIIDRHLSAKIRSHTVGVIAKGVALSTLGGEHQELIVLHVETELLADVVVVLGSLVTGTAGAVEAGSSVDARGCDVAVVLTRDGVAGAALGRTVGRTGHGSCGEEGGEEDSDGLHFDDDRYIYGGVNECRCFLGSENAFQRLID